MNELTRVELPDSQMIEVLRNSFYPEAHPDSVAMVLAYCRARGLDPMRKPVHIVPIWSQSAGRMIPVVMPGIGQYRIDAARTGQYVGKDEPEFGPDRTENLGGVHMTYPQWCKVTVKRLIGGNIYLFTAKEYWLENYAVAKKDTQTPNAMWRRRPYGQLAKCAESQALRMAFPEEAGGTNTAEEMEGQVIEAEYTVAATPSAPSFASPQSPPPPAPAAPRRGRPPASDKLKDTPSPPATRPAPAQETAGPDRIQAGVDKHLANLETINTTAEMNSYIGDPTFTAQREWLATDPTAEKYRPLSVLLEEAISVTVDRVLANENADSTDGAGYPE